MFRTARILYPPANPTCGSVRILRLERVTKSYGRRPVLREVDLEVPTGAFAVVLGANGSGKTTLLRLLSSYARPSSGLVRWLIEGNSLAPEDARAEIGFAGHVPLLYDELSARENVEFQVRVRGAASGDAQHAANQWLDHFGLSRRADERVATFSRGLRQRAALASAFSPEPAFLLLDEPGTALDATGLEYLLVALQAVRAKTTVVLATHEVTPFRGLADRALEVRDGAVQPWGGFP